MYSFLLAKANKIRYYVEIFVVAKMATGCVERLEGIFEK